MRIAIVGSRSFTDYNLMCASLHPFVQHIDAVLCGEARGADALGKRWALDNRKVILSYPADWDQYGGAAGPIRNKQMAESCDWVMAFWDGSSPGTLNMINTSRGLGRLVWVIPAVNWPR